MSGTKRRTPPAVIAELLRDPHRFSFFQAVRLIQRWLAKSEGLSDIKVLTQRLRFRNSLSLNFPASEIADLRIDRVEASLIDSDATAADNTTTKAAAPSTPRSRAANDPKPFEGDELPPSSEIRRIEITPTFMGLLGVTGVLPTHYTELLAQREHFHRDGAARAFLDIFQHRAVALFYQGWRKHRLPLHYESDGEHRYLPLILAVAGLGQTPLRNRLRPQDGGVSDHAIAFYAGALHKRSLSAPALQRVVEMYFGVQVRLEQFVGRWFYLPPSQHSLVGLGHATLGQDALLGERIWQRDLRMKLDIGPMTREKFQRFLPGSSAALALRELLELMTGTALEYEVRLHLRADEVRGSALRENDGPQLGWDSFLVTRAQTVDRSDAGYDLLAIH